MSKKIESFKGKLEKAPKGSVKSKGDEMKVPKGMRAEAGPKIARIMKCVAEYGIMDLRRLDFKIQDEHQAIKELEEQKGVVSASDYKEIVEPVIRSHEEKIAQLKEEKKEKEAELASPEAKKRAKMETKEAVKNYLKELAEREMSDAEEVGLLVPYLPEEAQWYLTRLYTKELGGYEKVNEVIVEKYFDGEELPKNTQKALESIRKALIEQYVEKVGKLGNEEVRDKLMKSAETYMPDKEEFTKRLDKMNLGSEGYDLAIQAGLESGAIAIKDVETLIFISNIPQPQNMHWDMRERYLTWVTDQRHELARLKRKRPSDPEKRAEINKRIKALEDKRDEIGKKFPYGEEDFDRLVKDTEFPRSKDRKELDELKEAIKQLSALQSEFHALTSGERLQEYHAASFEEEMQGAKERANTVVEKLLGAHEVVQAENAKAKQIGDRYDDEMRVQKSHLVEKDLNALAEMEASALKQRQLILLAQREQDELFTTPWGSPFTAVARNGAIGKMTVELKKIEVAAHEIEGPRGKLGAEVRKAQKRLVNSAKKAADKQALYFQTDRADAEYSNEVIAMEQEIEKTVKHVGDYVLADIATTKQKIADALHKEGLRLREEVAEREEKIKKLKVQLGNQKAELDTIKASYWPFGKEAKVQAKEKAIKATEKRMEKLEGERSTLEAEEKTANKLWKKAK